MRCEKCLNGFPVISENGMHYRCTLVESESLACLMGRTDHFIQNPMKKDGDEKDESN